MAWAPLCTSPEVVLSPILVRPVREQLEHDRVIRLLQAKYKRKFETAINPGHEQNGPVGGPPPWFPDLVLQSSEKSRRLLGVVEVETTESINHLEAMSQWGAFAAACPVPPVCARRLGGQRPPCCTDLQIRWPSCGATTRLAIRFASRWCIVTGRSRSVAGEAGKAAAPRASRRCAARRLPRGAPRRHPRRRKPAAAAKAKSAPARRGAAKRREARVARSTRTQKRR